MSQLVCSCWSHCKQGQGGGVCLNLCALAGAIANKVREVVCVGRCRTSASITRCLGDGGAGDGLVMVTMVTMGGGLQPGCLADGLLTGLGLPQINT